MNFQKTVIFPQAVSLADNTRLKRFSSRRSCDATSTAIQLDKNLTFLTYFFLSSQQCSHSKILPSLQLKFLSMLTEIQATFHSTLINYKTLSPLPTLQIGKLQLTQAQSYLILLFLKESEPAKNPINNNLFCPPDCVNKKHAR